MLKPVLITCCVAIVAALAIVFAIAARRPSAFSYTRSTRIAASPEVVYAQLADFRRWTNWSPWEHRDENLTRRYSGPDAGVGATYAWEGKKAGAGSMTIKDADPSRGVFIDLHFTKPFEAKNIASFTLTPHDGGTDVTWTMTGHNNLLLRTMCMFFDMDEVIGKDFDQGLASLKRVSERPT